jgi:hypothetical protein
MEVYKRSINAAKAKKVHALYYHIVTFKDLQRLVQSQSGPGDNQLLQRLRSKPFWVWDRYEHKQTDRANNGNCCFNHIIGLPVKDGIRKPLFEYEKMLYKALLEPGYLNSGPGSRDSNNQRAAYNFKVKHLWVKKATGLGVTELGR